MRKALLATAVLAATSLAFASSAQPQAARPAGAAPAPAAPTWSVGGKDAAWFAARPDRPDQDSEPLEPFKIVGDVYYVGARNISSILIATPKGHILIDTGTTKMGAVVLPNVVKLGFKPSDIKVLLISHAHFDHVQTTEIVRRITGATMMALEAEVPALSTGHDYSSIESEGFEPIRIDKALKDGDEFSLGGDTVKVIWTPGHTPGTATYVITTHENGRAYQVVFGGPPNPIAGNPKFNTRPEDAANSYRQLRTLNPDIVIGGHSEEYFKGKLDAARANTRPSPFQMAPGAWAKSIDDSEGRFKRQLAESMGVAPKPAD